MSANSYRMAEEANAAVGARSPKNRRLFAPPHLKRLALDRWQSRLRELVCYAGLTVVLFGLLVFRLPVMLGLPASAYSAQGVVTAPSVLAYALDPSYLLLGGVMLECSLIVSLLAWLADRFLPRRAAKQEQAPGT